MCCNKSIAKLFLVVFNTLFFLFGALCLAIGIWFMVDSTWVLTTLGRAVPNASQTIGDVINKISFLESGTYVLIAGGAVIFVIGFCGCCGALKEVKCLLLIYAICVGLIIALEVAAGLLGYFYTADVEKYLQNGAYQAITAYYIGATLVVSGGAASLSLDGADKTGVSLATDFAQATFQCCGVYNYTDYSSASAWPASYNYSSGTISPAAVPVSCCKMTDPSFWPAKLDQITFVDLHGCLANGNATATNTAGCYSTIRDTLLRNGKLILGIGIGIGGVELFGLLCAICLYRAVTKADTQVA